jgi:hypothetical protein
MPQTLPNYPQAAPNIYSFLAAQENPALMSRALDFYFSVCDTSN